MRPGSWLTLTAPPPPASAPAPPSTRRRRCGRLGPVPVDLRSLEVGVRAAEEVRLAVLVVERVEGRALDRWRRLGAAHGVEGRLLLHDPAVLGERDHAGRAHGELADAPEPRDQPRR